MAYGEKSIPNCEIKCSIDLKKPTLILTLFPLALLFLCCMISWNSSSILLYLASVPGVRLASNSVSESPQRSSSGLPPGPPLWSFLLRACKKEKQGSYKNVMRSQKSKTRSLGQNPAEIIPWPPSQPVKDIIGAACFWLLSLVTE